MPSNEPTSVLSQEAIQEKVIQILQDMTADWELEYEAGIGSETRLMGDLAFESLDIVQLVVALEKGFGKKNLPFAQLFMHDGDYVDDLLVRELVDFLKENLDQASV